MSAGSHRAHIISVKPCRALTSVLGYKLPVQQSAAGFDFCNLYANHAVNIGYAQNSRD